MGRWTQNLGEAMLDPDKATRAEGDHLDRLIQEVKREFFARSASTSFEGGFREANTLRVVAVEVLEGLALEAQIATLSDLFLRNECLVLRRDAADIFVTADSPAGVLTDLVCEVVWQLLIEDPLIQMEDEARETCAGY